MNAPVDLPQPLQRWQPWLGWFEPTLADALGELVRRLSELVGPAPAAGGRGALEPDGLGDLRLRGSYERLLCSEWLLADEMPEEFLRRAAAAEHLFLAPQWRAVPSDRVVVAVFDAGPLQLGAPRLGHLAAWVLLARRAADLGGALRWGVLQSPGQLHEADQPERLRELLKARSLAPGDAASEERWRKVLAPGPESLLGAAEAEVWWIGAAGATPARGERRLALRQTLAEDGLDVRLATATAVRQTWLPLPKGETLAPLLRGHFERPQAHLHAPADADARQRVALNRAPLFNRRGLQVAVPALEGHAMLVFKLKGGGQRRTKWRRQQWSAARPMVAAQLIHGQCCGIGLDAQQLHFWQVDRFPPRQRPPTEVFEPAVSAGRWMPLAVLANGQHRLACVIDVRGRLIAWKGTDWSASQGAEGEARKLDEQVLGFTPLDHERLVYAVFYGNGLWLRELSADGEPTPLRRRLCKLDSAQTRVFFALHQRAAPARLGALAVLCQHQPHETWRLLVPAGPRARPFDEPDGIVEIEMALTPGERAVGLIARADQPPGLVVRDRHSQLLQVATPEGRRLLFQGADRITQCSVCPDSGRVALLTMARQLIVLDGFSGERLLTVHDTAHPAPDSEPEDADDD